ncbi:MAG: CopD family protein [Bacteroidia bacterium]|nr:CopD family protein [Bacteroidia bacterium]NNK90612.1 TIGR00701 family protein [Saprospiraceae bacterium]
MIYLFLKALHVISMVAWFAGLIYLVRLFIYHSDALNQDDADKSILTKQYAQMSLRLYKNLCNPGMMLTWFFGIAMIAHNGMEWFGQNGWLHVKVLLVILLTVYHLYLKKVMKSQANNENKHSGLKLRLLSEVPTVFLITIVMLGIFKTGANIMYVVGGMVLLALIIYIGIKSTYKN